MLKLIQTRVEDNIIKDVGKFKIPCHPPKAYIVEPKPKKGNLCCLGDDIRYERVNEAINFSGNFFV